MNTGSESIRSDEERLSVWLNLMRVHAAVSEALSRDLEAARNLPLPWFEVLLGIAQEPEGRRRMQDLAGFALISKSGLSRLIDRMERAGLVRRESCPSDRRGTFAALTEEGATALELATPVFLAGFERHVANHLSDADVRALQAALGKVLEANDEPADVACRAFSPADSVREEPARRPQERAASSPQS